MYISFTLSIIIYSCITTICLGCFVQSIFFVFLSSFCRINLWTWLAMTNYQQDTLFVIPYIITVCEDHSQCFLLLLFLFFSSLSAPVCFLLVILFLCSPCWYLFSSCLACLDQQSHSCVTVSMSLCSVLSSAGCGCVCICAYVYVRICRSCVLSCYYAVVYVSTWISELHIREIHNLIYT